MRSMGSVLLASCLLVAAGVWLAPTPASAKEESKIQINLDPVSGGVAHGRTGGRVRTQLMPGRAGLHLQVKGLAPETEYALLSDGVEITRFTTGRNGQANVKVDLLAPGGDLSAPPIDPRGTLLTISDGVSDVYAGWHYGPVENDPSRVHVKESTHLAPDALAAPSGDAIATYMMTPNRKGRLRIQLKAAPPGDYEIFVDDQKVGDLTTNPAGNANADFRSDAPPPAAAGHAKPKKPGKVKLPLDFDPRLAWIELRQGGVPIFAGEMAAQIGGLNLCLPTPIAALPLAPTAVQPAATGTVALSVEDDCGRALEVAVAGLAPGSYDLLVAGAVVATLAVAPDGTGVAVFATTPDEPGELPLDFALPAGAAITLEAAGEEVLTGLLP